MYKKISAIAAALAVLLISAPVLAAPKLAWQKEVSQTQCDAIGKPVINVQQKVLNDVDSGEAGNYWAFDTAERHIQVWAQSDGTYCAVVSYAGKFDGVAGQTSPGDGGTLSGDEKGTFQGGYRATITGTLLASPLWPARGSVGKTDYQCDISGVCPGYVSWIGQYFEPSYGFDYEWWGWIYHGGKYGVWINSVDGNTGDILDS